MMRTLYSTLISLCGLGLLALPAQAPAGKTRLGQRPEQKPATAKQRNPIAVLKVAWTTLEKGSESKHEAEIELELFTNDAPLTVKNFIELAEGKKEWTDPTTDKQVKRPFYDGLVFHRVIDKFMLQSGCPRGNGTGDPGYKFADEINAKALGLDKLKAMPEENKPHPWLLIRSQPDFQRLLLLPLLKKLGIEGQEELEERMAEVRQAMSQLTLLDAYQNLGYVYNDKISSHPPKRGALAMANSGPNTNGSQFFINLVDTPHLTGKHTVFGTVVKGMEAVDAIGKLPVGQQDRPLRPVTIVSVRLKKQAK